MRTCTDTVRLSPSRCMIDHRPLSFLAGDRVSSARVDSEPVYQLRHWPRDRKTATAHAPRSAISRWRHRRPNLGHFHHSASLTRLDCADVTEYWRISERERSLWICESYKVCLLAKTAGLRTHTRDRRTDGHTHTERKREKERGKETGWLTEIVLSCNKY